MTPGEIPDNAIRNNKGQILTIWKLTGELVWQDVSPYNNVTPLKGFVAATTENLVYFAEAKLAIEQYLAGLKHALPAIKEPRAIAETQGKITAYEDVLSLLEQVKR